jgi:protease-4
MTWNRRIRLFAATVAIICGCAPINIPILQPLGELQERTIEGQGSAKLLLVDIEGFISEKARSGMLREQPSMVAEVRETFRKAEKDPDVAGVILRINSPGGTVSASDIIHHELMMFRGQKKVPVIACITGIGASGAYYIATAADEISAHPTAITGSIGVMVIRFNIEGLMEKIGVSEKTVKSGDKKDLLSPFRPATKAEEKIVQEIIDSLHGRFLDKVLARPGGQLVRKELEGLADGRIFTAEQALGSKLIDRIGYLDDTIALMKERLKLKDARVVSYSREGGYRGAIYSASPSNSPQMLSFINVNADGLGLTSSTEFMYLWQP